ncbi:TPA: UDP-N-acetylglucosamine 1-carboxyvinyltransferase, partial [Patescibacteria group bacterium]|nr:UDP-N-acetylglucosamine 1-carboxyvinyltransferase [Patescibacteria group bacterium]
MEKLIVQGGKPLRGEIAVSGAKNVAMKAIIAALLTEETIHIKNIPLISSVLGTARIITSLGAKINRTDHELTISGKGVHKFQVPLELGGLYRTATMTIGPLLARFGKAVVPNPGGCRLGKRPVDWHIHALEKMGATITYQDGYFVAVAKQLHGTKIEFAKNTHTGTETVILAAVLAEGETVIENAAAEPEVDDL